MSCIEAARLPVVRRDLGKMRVEAPVSTSMEMTESLSVSHSSRAGAVSANRGWFLGWNGAGAGGGGGGVGTRAGAGGGLGQLETGVSRCEGEAPSPWSLTLAFFFSLVAAGEAEVEGRWRTA